MGELLVFPTAGHKLARVEPLHDPATTPADVGLWLGVCECALWWVAGSERAARNSHAKHVSAVWAATHPTSERTASMARHPSSKGARP